MIPEKREKELQQKKEEEKKEEEAVKRREEEKKEKAEKSKEDTSISKKRKSLTKVVGEKVLPSLRSKRVKHIARKSTLRPRTPLSSESQAFEPTEKVRSLFLCYSFIISDHYCSNIIIFISGNCHTREAY